MTYIDCHEGKVRKRHLCRVCGEVIAAGEECHIYRGVEDGEGFYTIYFHDECWVGSRDWDEMDWEEMWSGEVPREEMRKAAKAESKGRDATLPVS